MAEYLSEEFKSYFENCFDGNKVEDPQGPGVIKREKRFREYVPEQTTFLEINPDRLFPKGSFERFLVNTIKGIDISSFKVTHFRDRGGKREYNPRSILALLFYGISDGTFSSRKLERLCIHDSRYIYVSGGETPEHTTISRFLNRYGDEICEVFIQVLYLADNMGYIDYENIVTDGSKFRAYAGSCFTGTIEEFTKRKNRLFEKIELALEKQKEADSDEERNYWLKKEEVYEKNLEKVSGFLAESSRIENESGKEVKQNIGDPDCRVMKNGQSFCESYNNQISVCARNGLITAFEATNRGNDLKSFIPMIEKTIANAQDKEQASSANFLDDSGYYSIENLLYAEKHNLSVYIPGSKDKDVYLDETGKEGADESKKITTKDCKLEYDGKSLTLCCPGGIVLKRFATHLSRGVYYYVYGVDDIRQCKGCVYYSRCQGALKKKKEFKMHKDRADNYHLVEEMGRKIRTPEGRMIYSKRMPAVEKVFGHFKGNLGFIRFLVKGLKKVNNYWGILCTVYNLKRMYNLTYTK